MVAVDKRNCWRKGRGIIATGLWILLGIPCACAVNSDHANSLRLANAEIALQSRKSELQAVKDELRECQREIRAVRQELVRCQAEFDGLDSIRNNKVRLLSEALAKVRLMEEDLAGATRRQAEVAASLAPLLALEQRVATRREEAAALQAQLPALDAQIAAGKQSLQAKSAALAEVKVRLEALALASKQLDAALKAVGPAVTPAPSKPGATAPPTKKK